MFIALSQRVLELFQNIFACVHIFLENCNRDVVIVTIIDELTHFPL